jgi:rubredoxin
MTMSERALRGSRLGAQSYETDSNVEMAPRQSVTYDCSQSHRFTMPFSIEADIPSVWECRVCGAEALRVDGDRPEPKRGRPARTHWDMLLERRSIAELEELLNERLALLRSGPSAPLAPARRKSA